VEIALKGRLQEAGIERVTDLLRKGVPGLISSGISLTEAEGLIQAAEMITLKGMGIENYRLLREQGVQDISELARQDPGMLYQRLRTIAPLSRAYQIPDPAIVRLWVREAQKEISSGDKDTRIQSHPALHRKFQI
jgi:predicted RecB family nuclease